MIKPGQKIHASVSFIKGYESRAKFSPRMAEGDWGSIIEKGRRDESDWAKEIENLLELDLFDYSNVGAIIDKFKQGPDNTSYLDRLTFIALTRTFTSVGADYDCSPLLTSFNFLR